MKLQLSLVLCLVTTISWSQNNEIRQLPTFSRINVGQAIKVYIKKGDKESCTIKTEGIEIREVLTNVNGKSLSIRLDQNIKLENIEVQVHLTYTEIQGLSVGSAASVYSETTIKTDKMEIDVSGAANAQLDVDVDELQIKVSNSGDLEITGNTRFQDIKVSGAGSLRAYKLNCEEVVAIVSNAGDAKIRASKRIDAKASNAGDIRYKGKPDKTNLNAKTAGSIKRVN